MYTPIQKAHIATALLATAAIIAQAQVARAQTVPVMRLGKAVETPAGFVSFCDRMPQECASSPGETAESVRERLITNMLAAIIPQGDTSATRPAANTPRDEVIADAPRATSARYLNWGGKPALDPQPFALTQPEADLVAVQDAEDSLTVVKADSRDSRPVTPALTTPTLGLDLTAQVPEIAPETDRFNTKRLSLAATRYQTRYRARTQVLRAETAPQPVAAPRSSDSNWYVDGVAPDKTVQAPTLPPATPREDVLTYSQVHMTPAMWREADEINFRVNQTIRSESDQALFGQDDFWNVPGMTGYPSGDCEDFALQKRHLLSQMGIPQSAMSLAIVRTERNEVHAVLVLSTTKGEYVLDNLSAQMKPWQKVRYAWLSRQGPNNSMAWYALDNPGKS
ncbi:MAG: transglutaminase-like cysteine peptidase [Asticcacaulis sp.]